MPKDLNKVIQTPAIAALITQLDELGYELYIRPKPLRYKDLQTALQASVEDAKIAEGAITKRKNAKTKGNT